MGRVPHVQAPGRQPPGRGRPQPCRYGDGSATTRPASHGTPTCTCSTRTSASRCRVARKWQHKATKRHYATGLDRRRIPGNTDDRGLSHTAPEPQKSLRNRRSGVRISPGALRNWAGSLFGAFGYGCGVGSSFGPPRERSRAVPHGPMAAHTLLALGGLSVAAGLLVVVVCNRLRAMFRGWLGPGPSSRPGQA